MTTAARIAALRLAMIVVGLIFVIGIYTLAQVWPSGWTWGMGPSHYLPMILGVYATLGVFLIVGSRDPLENTTLLWFTVWSSVVHAALMLVMTIKDAGERPHLLGDIPALLIVAGVLAVLTRGATRAA